MTFIIHCQRLLTNIMYAHILKFNAQGVFIDFLSKSFPQYIEHIIICFQNFI